MNQVDTTGQQVRIVLGVTGGIAAYKTVELLRLLTGRGYQVFPIMTPWATRFVGPLTLEALSGHSVRMETPTSDAEQGIEHISLIRSASLLLIAPLTANTLAKMATGLADNFLTATYLAHRGLTLACPAMNTAMLNHPATRRNLELVQKDGVRLCFGDAGDLACGETGAGRMADPSEILDQVELVLSSKIQALQGKKVLVSAGPTQEDLDPVRFLTNRSSGKMGIAVACAFRNAGAQVTLVAGPVNQNIPKGMEVVSVRSADEMAQAILPRQKEFDMVVMAAAVADYRPSAQAQKLKKSDFDGNLVLQRTTDILATLGKHKPPHQILAGFAAETQAIEQHAKDKLARKNLDFIFANDVSKQGLGFGSDHNRLMALDRQGRRIDLGTNSKGHLAKEMVALMAAAFSES